MIIPNNHKIFADIIHLGNKNTGLFRIFNVIIEHNSKLFAYLCPQLN